MATVTASSNFVPRNSHINCGPSVSSESKVTPIRLGFLKHTISYNGLRVLNSVDELQNRSTVKVNARKAKLGAIQSKNARHAGRIICGMNLIFVGTEVAPWSKTGGLGDVLGGLPPAMAANGHRVMTIAPRYDQYKDAWDTRVIIEVKVGGRTEKVRFFHCYKRGVDRVFVDHPMFLEKVWGKTGTKLYGPMAGDDYKDNQLRFSLFCQAFNRKLLLHRYKGGIPLSTFFKRTFQLLCGVSLEAPRVLNLNSSQYFSGPYGEDVIFIANDWHTALLPCYLKSMYQSFGVFKNVRVVFCIHNIAYQGRFAFSDFSYLNLPDQFRSSFDFIDRHVRPVIGRKINWMKAGILESDQVLTVSPYYAKELVSGPDKGVEQDNILRRIGIIGIVNGMDVQEWNPSTDKYILVKYNAATVTMAKALLKEALQAEVGLPIDRNIPLIGFIGRLEEQKGSDILVAAIPHFIRERVQIVALGTGKKQMEKQLQQLEILYPDKARGVAKFNVPLAHMIIAGADFILVPSRFEPCGLIQLQGMRYGTVPIVASTGGLVDTVKEGYAGFQMGSFNVECDAVDPADVAALAKTVVRALAVYGTLAFAEIIRNCMAQGLSWKGSAKKWEEVLLRLGVAGSEPGIDGEEIAPQAKENVATLKNIEYHMSQESPLPALLVLKEVHGTHYFQ